MHESLIARGEETAPSRHAQILRATSRVPAGVDIDLVLETLTRLAADGNDDAIRAELARVIPDADFVSRPLASEPERKR